jgi:hypothetical protein
MKNNNTNKETKNENSHVVGADNIVDKRGCIVYA